MSDISSDCWQHVFTFLDVDSCEMATEVFPNANEAFMKSMFVVAVKRSMRLKMHHYTSREMAELRYRLEVANRKRTKLEHIVMSDALLRVVKEQSF